MYTTCRLSCRRGNVTSWQCDVILSLDGRQSIFLLLSEFRMPEVDNENQPGLVTTVPNLVLEWVVEDNKLSLFPSPNEWVQRFYNNNYSMVNNISLKCVMEKLPRVMTYMIYSKRNRYVAHLISSATRISGPSGMTSPKWARIRQLVGPQWGHTWTPGCITENFTCNHIKYTHIFKPQIDTWWRHFHTCSTCWNGPGKSYRT